MKKCKNASRYKGIRRPKCNGGKPCKASMTKYNENVLRTLTEKPNLMNGTHSAYRVGLHR